MENTREVLGSSEDGTISYIRLTEDLLEDALRVLQEGFYPFECVSIASNVPKNPKAVAELNILAAECIKEGVSVAAIDNQTNKVIGVSVNKIQVCKSLLSKIYFQTFQPNNHIPRLRRRTIRTKGKHFSKNLPKKNVKRKNPQL